MVFTIQRKTLVLSLCAAILLVSLIGIAYVFVLPQPTYFSAKILRAPALTNNAAIPLAYRDAAAKVASYLTVKGENPGEFYVDIGPETDGKVVFHLWHKSAFESQNMNVVGNPGGKNRDVFYDLRSASVTNMLFWQ